MKIDAPVTADMRQIASQAVELESLGYDGIRLAELNHDPFLPLTLAAEHTRRIELVTSVAVAFSRNPMTMAQLAHDLNSFSNGRLVLGLGSQVKPHIQRRFSMPWHKAAAQMREFIEAMNAIYDCWYDGARLDYQGEYYQHNLMPATFTPDNVSGARPKIVLSATGPLMTRVAAEIADGMIMHPFSSAKYMTEVTIPAIQEGLRISGRDLDGFVLDYAPMIATGGSDEAVDKAVRVLRGRIAFYGCTVAYKPVLDIHGWGDLQDELIVLNRQHRTDDMAALISDDMVNTIGIVGTPEEVVEQMNSRFANLISRTSFHVPDLPAEQLKELLSKLKA
ncbi:MAG: TIGR03617 family F420-dependent LLM class oxidoreductase [Pseudomonadaceae bacterium]|nr:TIGR03617 family F420-dependent LLM class oxidoreductase [Pseudomonadaceae bacterium]